MLRLESQGTLENMYKYIYIYLYTTCFLFFNKFRIGLPENVWLLFSFVWVQWMQTCHRGPNIYRKHNMNFAPICCIPPTNLLKILGLVLGRVHSLYSYCLFRATSRGTVTGDRWFAAKLLENLTLQRGQCDSARSDMIISSTESAIQWSKAKANQKSWRVLIKQANHYE